MQSDLSQANAVLNSDAASHAVQPAQNRPIFEAMTSTWQRDAHLPNRVAAIDWLHCTGIKSWFGTVCGFRPETPRTRCHASPLRGPTLQPGSYCRTFQNNPSLAASREVDTKSLVSPSFPRLDRRSLQNADFYELRSYCHLRWVARFVD